MRAVGYGVVTAGGKPVGIWPVSRRRASALLERRRKDGERGDQIVPVYVGPPVPALRDEPVVELTLKPA